MTRALTPLAFDFGSRVTDENSDENEVARPAVCLHDGACIDTGAGAGTGLAASKRARARTDDGESATRRHRGARLAARHRRPTQPLALHGGATRSGRDQQRERRQPARTDGTALAERERQRDPGQPVPARRELSRLLGLAAAGHAAGAVGVSRRRARQRGLRRRRQLGPAAAGRDRRPDADAGLEPAVRTEHAGCGDRHAHEERLHPSGGNDRGLWRFIRPRQRPVRGRTRVRRRLACVRGGHLVQRERLARLFAVDRRPVLCQGRQAHADLRPRPELHRRRHRPGRQRARAAESSGADADRHLHPPRPDQEPAVDGDAGRQHAAAQRLGTVRHRLLPPRAHAHLQRRRERRLRGRGRSGRDGRAPRGGQPGQDAAVEFRRGDAMEHRATASTRSPSAQATTAAAAASSKAARWEFSTPRAPSSRPTPSSSRIRSTARSAITASTRPTPSPCCRTCSSRCRAATTWPK